MKLLDASAFRISIQFAIIFTVIASGALVSVYIITFSEIKEQIDRELIHELNELKSHHEKFNTTALKEHIKNRQQYGKHLHHYYALTDNKLRLLSGSQYLIPFINPASTNTGEINFSDAFNVEHEKDDDNRLRIASLQLDNKYYLVAAQSNSSISELQEHTTMAIIIAIIITLTLAFSIGLYMSKQALAKINSINEGLEKSITHNFAYPLPVPKNEDEFQALILKLNLMLEKIKELIIGMRQVTDNIAHDLRNPLTRLKNRLEVTLLHPRKDTEYQYAMENAIEDCNELLKTFNSLLSIAQAEAGVRRDSWQLVELSELIDDMIELYRVVAEKNELSLIWNKTEPIKITGNRQLLAQSLSNLLENAIKYSNKGGTIYLRLYKKDKHPVVEICDTGPGIPKQHRKKVLDRFQRLDSSRSTPGSGLGLSLVKAVSKLHSAQLQLQDNKPGLCVKIIFNLEGISTWPRNEEDMQ